MSGNSKYKFVTLLIGTISIILISLLLSNWLAHTAAGMNQNILPVNSKLYNATYADWLEKWWQWYIGIPAKDHPNNNPSAPEKCGMHQEGPVWFLPNIPESKSTITHSCIIPSGKAIAFTIETGECDSGMREIGNNLVKMLTCATKGNDPQYTTLQASIDGIKIEDPKQFRVQTTPFNITIPTNNIYDADKGTFKALASGYIYILKPLSPGKHTIVYSDQINNPLEQQYNHVKREIFNLVVK